ncbi:hypothetical protein DFR86_08255 [Acidianus sulfidivorans JP7]|uniref:VIT family protein n=1 Tax=Acidianus sulfidivorans JP7 TaxID=619593 RepID=A0A2U9ING2_9CREN|nr:hypothetical protein [Acidianus sulfidivorans]AWR97545.1 hypothetical protein DFR86_08255 [Acidianus sulfidivorans JP7]
MLDKIIDGLKYSLKNDKSILRRYLILGSFDGLLLSVSIITSAIITHLSTRTTDITVISGLISISISSILNSAIAEIKEREIEFEYIEKQMMKSLKGTIYDYGMKITIILSALAHGFSPFLGIIILLAFNYTRNLLIILLSSSAILFGLGILYEGDIKEKIKTSIFIVLAGLVVAFIVYLIN